jgi:hypothetical protein
VVRYPSSYSYPGTYATRSLTPLPGYAAGSSTFTAIDISNTISSDAKYAGGVLGPNGLIYFVPINADNIGVLNPSSSSFTAIDIFNTISSDNKYYGGVLGPNGLIYFVPINADDICVLNPSSSSFTAIDISNTISSDAKYAGGVLGPSMKEEPSTHLSVSAVSYVHCILVFVFNERGTQYACGCILLSQGASLCYSEERERERASFTRISCFYATCQCGSRVLVYNVTYFKTLTLKSACKLNRNRRRETLDSAPTHLPPPTSRTSLFPPSPLSPPSSLPPFQVALRGMEEDLMSSSNAVDVETSPRSNARLRATL